MYSTRLDTMSRVRDDLASPKDHGRRQDRLDSPIDGAIDDDGRWRRS